MKGGERKMTGRREVVTVWFGKEISIEEVRLQVKKLVLLGYTVRAPFYIGYKIDKQFVSNYLKNSLEHSDYLYILGEEGSLLEEIVEHASTLGKPIMGKENLKLCSLS